MRYRIQSLLEFVTFLGLALTLLFYLLTGQYQLFVTTRAFWPLLLTAIVLGVLALVMLLERNLQHYRLRLGLYVALLLPLLLMALPNAGPSAHFYAARTPLLMANGLALPNLPANGGQPGTPGAQPGTPGAPAGTPGAPAGQGQGAAQPGQGANGGLPLNTDPNHVPYASQGVPGQSGQGGHVGQGAPGTTPPNGGLINPAQGSGSKPLGDYNLDLGGSPVGKIPPGGTIDVSDAGFYPWFVDLLTKPDTYKGARIEITGFVFAPNQRLGEEGPVSVQSSDTVPNYNPAQPLDSQFLTARLAMICCAADMTPLGLFAENRTGTALTVGNWYRFSGQLEERVLNQRRQLVIVVDRVQPAQQPNPPYVIPITPPPVKP